MAQFKPVDITKAVETHKDEDKYGAKDGKTFCNFFVRDVVEDLLQQTRPEFQGNANTQFDNLSKSSDWKAQDFSQDPSGVFSRIHDQVNAGQLAIVAYKNPTGDHGHIAVLVPSSSMEDSGAWKMPVPFIAQAGKINPRNNPAETDKSVFSSLKLSWGFSSKLVDDMEIFVWST